MGASGSAGEASKGVNHCNLTSTCSLIFHGRTLPGHGTRGLMSNAIRNCPLCVMKNCPQLGFMISVEGWFRR
jgi:hypothetical protein